MTVSYSERAFKMSSAGIPEGYYPVMEIFQSIQGEGFHQGKKAWFIRLGGCDVGCHWCDVKTSWQAENFPLMQPQEILGQLSDGYASRIIITGGEPLMYNLDALTKCLHDSGFRLHIETAGAYPLSGSWDWICLSPKKFKPPQPGILPYADELKIIVYNKSDLQWAMHFKSLVKPGCKLFLQPEWSVRKKVHPLIRRFILDNPEWQLSIQIHKYLNLP